MKRRQSPSSLSTFLNCPYSYYLTYIENVPKIEPKKTEFGSWIHDQLTKQSSNELAKEFTDPIKKWLEENGEEIDLREFEIKTDIDIDGNCQQLIGKIDAMTKNGMIIDFKVTQNSQWHMNRAMPQLRIYDLIMWLNNKRARKAYKDITAAYLLIEYRTRQKNYQEVPSFESLIFMPIVTTNLSRSETLLEIRSAVKMIYTCEEEGNFPPSFTNCERCFVRKSCKYYSGF